MKRIKRPAVMPSRGATDSRTRKETTRLELNSDCGLLGYYLSGKWNSCAELRAHSPHEIMWSIMTAHEPKLIEIYEL